MDLNIDMTELKRGELIYSGKANDVYSTNDERVLEIVSTDRVSAGNGKKKSTIKGKGRSNNKISTAIFKKLEEAGVRTHFIAPGTDDQSKFVLKTEPILLEVIGRFKTAGSFCKEFKLPADIEFDGVFVEFTFKSDAESDPRITDREILKEGILKSPEEVKFVRETTEKAAYVFKDFFAQCNGELIDFKIEFGYLPDGSIIIIDEVSGDTVRVKDLETGESLDKDRFRKDLENVSLGYSTLEDRLDNL